MSKDNKRVATVAKAMNAAGQAACANLTSEEYLDAVLLLLECAAVANPKIKQAAAAGARAVAARILGEE